MKSLKPSPLVNSAAQCLRRGKLEVLSLWEMHARQELPGAAENRHFFLIDSLPRLVDELIDTLESSHKRIAIKEIGQDAAQRAVSNEFSLEQVQIEFEILHRVLLEFLEKDASVNFREWSTVLNFVVERRLAAADEYMRVAQQKIIRSEERLSLALESAQMGTFDWDLKSGTLNWSDTLKRLWGYDPREFSNSTDNFWARIHPADRAQVEKAIQDSFSKKGDYQAEYRIVWPDQSIHWIYARGRAYRDQYGNVARRSGTCIEITARKKIESSLKLSEEKFRRIYESNMVGLVFASIDGKVYEANDYFLNIVGYSRGELQKGKVNWVELTPREYLPLDQHCLEEMKKTGTCAPFEKPYRRRDGSIVWVIVTGAFLDETHYKHISLIVDITEQRRIREKLRESESELRLVTESIPQIIWSSTAEGSPDHFNKNWYSYTRLTPGKGEGRVWLSFVHPDDKKRNLEAWEKALTNGTSYVIEHRLRRHDGIYRWFLTRAEPLKDSSGRVVRWFGTSTDIEDQKRTQQALEEERELRDQFVSMLSHDLRNPLSAAMTSAQLIARNPDATDRIPSFASRIVDNIARADQMIQNLLDANRIRAGKGLPIEFSKCDLAQIAEKICENLSTIHGDRFVRRFPETLEGEWGCKDLQRVLENLLTNAIKYGDRNPITIKLTDQGANVEISVHNFGEPISQEEQVHLFEPFMRSKSVELGKKIGWGLGLTLVRAVVEAHGGRIVVESSRECGTTFTVFLPKHRHSV